MENMLNNEVNVNSSINVILILIIVNACNINSNHEKRPGIIYVHTWTDANREPFRFWSSKSKSLKLMNCEFQNCFIIKDRGCFLDVTDYDVLLFNPMGINDKDMPLVRSDNQLYVFVAVESAAYNPLSEDWNWFFNYTFTYKLDSDVVYPYFTVRNKHGDIVGPKLNAHWKNITRMRPTGESVIEKLKNKTIAAAWFVTNCYNINQRLGYAHRVNHFLNKYNLNLDIYGRCGSKFCPKDDFENCIELVENNYYFYFTFENSDCEDYVTEKLMTALDHYTVPVVLGGSNYSRFMPDGIYLNGNLLSEDEVARKISEAIQDQQKYYDYFRWHQYYTYHFTAESSDSDPLCAFCAFLNDESNRYHRRVYARFNKWWTENGNHRDAGDIIVSYDDSGPHIKSVLTYRNEQIEVGVASTPSTLEQVNSFVGELVNYYFGS